MGVRSIAFAPDGKTFATADFYEGRVKLRDPHSGAARVSLRDHNLRAATVVNAVAFAPDGRTLAAAYLDGFVELWDVPTATVRSGFRADPKGVYTLAVSPDGRTFLTGGWDQNAKVWDLATAKQRFLLHGHQRPVEAAVFSPDGKTIATTSWDQTVKLWEAATGLERLTLRGHKLAVLAAAFSPDGKTLATTSGRWGDLGPDREGRQPGEIKLWDTATGEELASILGHQDRVWSVAFSPDGKSLATASWDRTVKLWDVPARRADAPARKLSAEELATLWNDLAANDAARAYRAIAALAGASAQTVLLLQERLKPAAPATPRITRLVAELDDDAFAVREKASHELAKMGEEAEPALRKALENAPSAELRRHAESLLEARKDLPPSAERLRALHATEVLERLHTPDSRRLLETLAQGTPHSYLTREAKASLERLNHRSQAAPRR